MVEREAGKMERRRVRALRLGIFLAFAGCLHLALGCHSLKIAPQVAQKVDKEPPLAPPSKPPVRVSPYYWIYADFEVKRDLPLFEELTKLREQTARELQLPASSAVVHVYLFEDRDRYERFMHAKYPDLPRRRAFFVAQPHGIGAHEDLMVYTFWGDRIQQDLRHELTHALLHSVLKDVPLWLDEGLAEYYELPSECQGVNQHHLEQIRQVPGGGFKPDLARLEQLSQVQQMTPTEYRESWAWVHLMMRGKAEAKGLLVNYLQELRANPNPGPLQPRLATLFPSLEDALEKHLAQLEAPSRSTPMANQR
jgi:hypothetical protein